MYNGWAGGGGGGFTRNIDAGAPISGCAYIRRINDNNFRVFSLTMYVLDDEDDDNEGKSVNSNPREDTTEQLCI